MRQREYSVTAQKDTKWTWIFKKGDIKFDRNIWKLNHSICLIHLVETLFPTSHMQKNCFKNAILTRCQTGKHFYPVKIWSNIIIKLESYLKTSEDSPVNTVWLDNCSSMITSKIKIKALRLVDLYFGDERIGFSQKDIVTHSILSVFSM